MYVLSANASTHVQHLLHVLHVLPETGGEQNWWRGAGQVRASLLMAQAVYRSYVHLLAPE
jgi:hypothetical protein